MDSVVEAMHNELEEQAEYLNDKKIRTIYFGGGTPSILSADFGNLERDIKMIDRSTAVLGVKRPVVRQRWLGRYADSPNTNLVLERPDARTTVAVVTSGIGMTLSFGVGRLALTGEQIPGF